MNKNKLYLNNLEFVSESDLINNNKNDLLEGDLFNLYKEYIDGLTDPMIIDRKARVVDRLILEGID